MQLSEMHGTGRVTNYNLLFLMHPITITRRYLKFATYTWIDNNFT